MPSPTTRRSPLKSAGPTPVKTSGVLSYAEWAAVIVAEAAKQHLHMTPQQVAEGLGVIESESGGNTSSVTPGNEHIGGLAESKYFGTEAQRLNPSSAVAAALKKWAEDGKSWWPAWGQWEKGETEGAGPTRAGKFLHIAEAALMGGRASGAILQATPGAPHTTPDAGAGGLMGFLLTVVLVGGGLSIAGLGVTRMVGAGRRQEGIK